jgi:serine/threonine protein kinase/Tfp pilus assembly protein PilF
MPSLEEIVFEARRLPPRERAELLDRLCGDDTALREQVMARLRESSPQWWDLEELGEAAGAAAESYVGQTIGPYRIVRTLGSGGMGEVVLAERADDQFRQQVAIKLVKRGLLSRQVRGRLKVERQILASLNHPNVARLLDGGVTPEGTPYIVMEYVEGLPIDEYCDKHRLSIRARLDLIKIVCSAVHAAHQNLIVHRDLKPSNILVTEEGVPKLLDFGIAKLLDERPLLHTVAVTQEDIRLMTPDHASPEQIQGLPVTTSSDIYVLGVLLYELLTGVKPFDVSSKRLAEMERVICEQMPVAPSEAIEALSASERQSLAAARSSSPGRWRKELAGDLDNIVLMALRKEPERRYASVEQFVADIDRFLRGLPVIARKDTWLYRAGKFTRRHAVAVGLSGALVASLIAFSIVTTVQAVRIQRERDAVAAQHARAEAERQRAESVSSFLLSAFRVSDPSEARGREIKAKEILDNAARRIEGELRGHPAMQAVMLDTMGRVYLNMGLLEDAEPLLEKALVIRRSTFAERHSDIAASLASLAQLRREQGHYEEAKALLDEAMEINTALHGARSAPVAENMHELGRVQYGLGGLDEAERTLKRAWEIYKVTLASGDSRITRLMDDLAVVLQARNDYAGAEELYRAALQRDRDTLGQDHPQYAVHLANLAAVTRAQGRLPEAERLLNEAIPLMRRVLGEEHPETIDALSHLGVLLQEKGDYEAAGRAYRSALELDRRLRGEDHDYVGVDLMALGSLAVAQAKYVEAEKLMREALDIFSKRLAPDHPFIITGHANLGRVLLEQGRFKAAKDVLERAIPLEEQVFGLDSEPVAIARLSLARVLAAQGQWQQAEPLFLHSYEILQASRGADAQATVQARGWIEEFYRKLGKPEAAQAYFASLQGSTADR